MTDPRAALADLLGYSYPATVEPLVEQLAERGVLLVTEDRLHAALWTALSDSGAIRIDADSPKESGDVARAIFAALSGEAT